MINNRLFIEPKGNYPTVYDRDAYKDFWKEQIDRCLNGYTVGGKYMPGMLYFHVNFWSILIGGDTPQNPIKYEAIAPLRDVEWELFGQLYRAKQEEKGIILITGRDLGKSFGAASFIGYAYTFYSNSESCVCSASEDDNKPLMQKIDFGLKKLPHALQHERIKDVANEIIWSGDRRSEKEKVSTFNSKIMVRNFSDGSKPMACNGLRPIHHVFEEIGKLNNLITCYDSSIPCWMAGARQAGTPFLIGTGGDMNKGEDASKMFYDPEPYNLLSYKMSDTEKSTGLFFPGYMSFNQYRDSEGVIDKQLAEKKLREKREEKRKAKDKQSYLTNVMYYPLTPQECFLRNKSNIFNVSKLNEDIAYLKTNKKYSEIIQKGNLNWVDSQKTRVKWEMDDINGMFQILLHPKEEEPYGLYVAGTDPYDIDVAKKGSSGSTFIFRRMLSAEEMYNLPVAQYTDRPDTAEQYYEGALKLLTYYNARTLCEAANVGLINYFKRIFKTNYLLPKPNFIKDLMPKSYAVRDYGVAMSKEFKGHMELWIRDYIEENCGVNAITNEPGKILFLDLLTELSKYNDEDNFDRVIAFGLCLGHKIEINNFQLKEKVQGNPYKLGKYVKDRNGNIYYEK